jgi:3-hydroxyisobutyrate dehydrogenase
MSLRVGFIGLGTMGAPMCAQVVRAGFEVTAFDLRGEAVAAARAAGAAGADSAAACARRADVLVTMLPGPTEVEDVLLGAGGALAALDAGALVADMSTSEPALGRRIAATAPERGIGFLDAPVADAKRAAEGRLHIMVGGDAADVERARPVLAAMGGDDRITHLGPAGSGYATKLLVNLQWFVHAVAAAEAFAIGLRAGLDVRALHGIFVSGPARSAFLEQEALEVLEDGDYAARFPLALVGKDLALTMDLAREAGVAVELSELTTRIYERARQRFGDGEGEPGAVRLYEELAGAPFRFSAAGAGGEAGTAAGAARETGPARPADPAGADGAGVGH